MNMVVKLVFLGTAASCFSEGRNPTSLLLSVDGKHLLMDCGDSTTRRLIDFGIDLLDVEGVYLSHGHADHCSGIVAFLWQQWLACERTTPLAILAQPYLLEKIDTLLELYHTPRGAFQYEMTRIPLEGGGGAPVNLPWLSSGNVSCSFNTARTVHSPGCTAIRLDFQAGGSKQVSLVYASDTAPSNDIAAFSRDATVLVHESTFLDDQEPLATSYNHSTPSGAARVANRAGAKKLVLVHYSVKLEGRENELEAQASSSFKGDVMVAKDGDEIVLLP